MDLERIILIEVTYTQKDKNAYLSHMSFLICSVYTYINECKCG